MKISFITKRQKKQAMVCPAGSRRVKPTIFPTIHGHDIRFTESVTNLGAILDGNLNGRGHIYGVSSKIIFY